MQTVIPDRPPIASIPLCGHPAEQQMRSRTLSMALMVTATASWVASSTFPTLAQSKAVLSCEGIRNEFACNSSFYYERSGASVACRWNSQRCSGPAYVALQRSETLLYTCGTVRKEYRDDKCGKYVLDLAGEQWHAVHDRPAIHKMKPLRSR